ncbi:hypothetical protein SDC9_175017 [bioreactor metagenome]|uniref:Uncharacterized protein n=1 Tax=bioreactor metagenome TaxID=1076179 RepID=A0A645GVB1_9ZZZZ
MFNNFNFVWRYIVNTDQQLYRLIAHHHYFGSCFIDFPDDVFLQKRGFFQDSMKNYGKWNFQPVSKGKDIQPRLPSKDSKFVIKDTSPGIA